VVLFTTVKMLRIIIIIIIIIDVIIIILSLIFLCLCGLVVRVPGYRTEMYRVSCEVRTEFMYVM
jgi:hypothetical protein